MRLGGPSQPRVGLGVLWAPLGLHILRALRITPHRWVYEDIHCPLLGLCIGDLFSGDLRGPPQGYGRTSVLSMWSLLQGKITWIYALDFIYFCHILKLYKVL